MNDNKLNGYVNDGGESQRCRSQCEKLVDDRCQDNANFLISFYAYAQTTGVLKREPQNNETSFWKILHCQNVYNCHNGEGKLGNELTISFFIIL